MDDSKGKAANDDMEREREREQEQEQNPHYNLNNNELSKELQLDEEDSESNLEQQQQASRTRTPFAALSQVDADLALAHTLQEQERAHMMLRMNNNEGSDYGSWEAGCYLHDEDDDESDADDHENHEYDGSDVVVVDEDGDDDEDGDEDAFDVHDHDEIEEDNNPNVEYDSDVFSSDETYARALQDVEERDMAARLLAFAGINDRQIEDPEDHGGHSLDTWEDVDPDELSYEELIALGEVVGAESRGLSTDIIASLPTVNYKAGTSQNGSNDSCVICRLDYEDGETLTLLYCKHSYHSECINNWLKINKVCPVCSAEVSTSGHS